MIKPMLAQAIRPGSQLYTGEYAIYTCLEEWGYQQKPLIMRRVNTHVMQILEVITTHSRSQAVSLPPYSAPRWGPFADRSGRRARIEPPLSPKQAPEKIQSTGIPLAAPTV
jgi:hypothetical protein